jgi:hypothetical protein
MLSRHRERRKSINNSIPNKPSRSLIEEVKPRRDITDSVIAEKASRQALSYQQQNRSDATEEDLYAAEIAKQLKPKDLAYAYYKNVPFKDLKKVYKDELKSGRKLIEGEHKRETKPSVTFEDVSDLGNGDDSFALPPGEEDDDQNTNLSEYQNPFEEDTQQSDYTVDDGPNWYEDEPKSDDIYLGLDRTQRDILELASYCDLEDTENAVKLWSKMKQADKADILQRLDMEDSFPITLKNNVYSSDKKQIKQWINRPEYQINLYKAAKDVHEEADDMKEINGSGLKGILKGKGILNNKKPSTRGRKKIPDIDVYKEFKKARGEIIDGNDGDQVKKIARDCIQILYYKGKFTPSDVITYKRELQL